jgi:hypothetical protein
MFQKRRDGCLGDDGKVRFYMVCTTATSLYILSLPALEVVFVYSPSTQHHQYYAHSSNNMAIPIAAGPALLYSSLPPPPDISDSTAATAATAATASSAASALFESVNDVALHFVGPLNGSSPCLVLCLETKENDVYVYHLHRHPEAVVHHTHTRYVKSVLLYMLVVLVVSLPVPIII